MGHDHSMLHANAIILLLACATCSTAVFGAESIKLGELADGTALSLASVEAYGAIRTVRTLTVFPSPREMLGLAGVVSELDTQLLDCAKRTQETTRIEFFANSAATGAPLRVIDFPLSVRTRVTVDPDGTTPVAAIFTAVCGRFYATSQAQNGADRPLGTAPAGTAMLPPEMTVRPTGTSMPPFAVPVPAAGPPAIAPRGTEALPLRIAPVPTPTTEAPPVPGSPVPSGAVAWLRPHANSIFTLRTMGLLSQYVYLDENRAEVLGGAVSLMDAAKARFVRPDNTGNPVVGLAHAKMVKREAAYRAGMNEKREFLRSEQLVHIALPAVSPRPPAAFRAELYRHAPSGEHILVFRGTQEMMDWVTNLWLAVDLLALEAPHYLAARELTAILVARGIRPMVVGHSLGGGLAQYVGVLNRLNVVGFNSSPLPRRYIERVTQQDLFPIRLFSAVEFSGLDASARGHSDPVSLHAANFGADLNTWARAKVKVEPIKAHLHAAPVACVRSVPTPFLSKDEDDVWAGTLNRMFYPTAVGRLLAGKPVEAGAEAAIQHYVAASTNRLFDDPGWIPAQSLQDERVLALTREALGDAAVDVYQMARGATAMGSILYNAMLGSSMAAMKGIAAPVGAAAGKLAVKRLLMPHSMERFNRGMLAEIGRDVFIANVVYGECRQPKGLDGPPR